MNSLFDDTICAVSTPPGVGGIAVVRISGSEAIVIADKVWRGKKLIDCATHTAHFGSIVDPESGKMLDQAVATVFREPNSFTGEDVVELSVHGSRWIQAELVRLLIRCGCRMAAAGEFTRRAFANNRLDLAEAEAVADLIASSSRAAQSIAISQLRGDFSRRLSSLRESLIELASLLELELDFSEEEVEFASRQKLLTLANEIHELVTRLAASYSAGSVIREGVPVAIVGATNAGKSSLLNALLGDDRAIVSDIHGTTRDTIEDTLDIDGVTFRLIDTAGLRRTADPIEALGIERSLKAAANARVVLWVVDSAENRTGLDETAGHIVKNLGEDSRLVVVANKADLPHSQPDSVFALAPEASAYCTISASTGKGLDQLRNTMIEAAGVKDALSGNEIVISNLRHYEALTASADSLARVISGLESGLSGDFIAQDLREALHHLSLITGAITTTDLLTTIFTRFCIGK